MDRGNRNWLTACNGVRSFWFCSVVSSHSTVVPLCEISLVSHKIQISFSSRDLKEQGASG